MSGLMDLLREAMTILSTVKHKPRDIVVDREDNILYILIEFETTSEAKIVEEKINEWKRRFLK